MQLAAAIGNCHHDLIRLCSCCDDPAAMSCSGGGVGAHCTATKVLQAATDAALLMMLDVMDDVM